MKALWSFFIHSILILCIYLWCPTTVSGLLQNETDGLALIAFKDGITHDSLGMLSYWNESIHFCHWIGISYSRRHVHRVVAINLSSYGLVGSLSPHIGNLTFLRTVILQNNSFHGEIPPQIVGLFHLRVLVLSNNSFGEEVPTNLSHCLNLKVLNLIDNKLIGKLPEELGSQLCKRWACLLTTLQGKSQLQLGICHPSSHFLQGITIWKVEFLRNLVES